LGITRPTMSEAVKESWDSGGAYELWVGRWSRSIAEEFIDWLAVSPGRTWGDVGCGTGALVERILGSSDPAGVLGIDRSEAYVSEARNRAGDSRVRFEVGDACALPWATETCDVTVSGLVLNFVPDSAAMTREMVRVTRPGGRVAAYVWDYAGGMQMIRHFWDVALELNRGDSKLDQAERFPLCQPGPLEQLFRRAGLISVLVRAIDVPTVFHDFDDYWLPFLGKQGAAPAYLASLPAATRDRIRVALKARLVAAADGSIAMTARAWAVRGTVPPNPALNRTGRYAAS
jgi:SAM-dependent methyltransferase